MKKFVLLVTMTAVILSLTACHTTDEVEIISRDFNQAYVDTFFEKMYQLDENTSRVLDQFAENNFQADENFLSSIHEVQEEYLELLAYTKTLTVEEYTSLSAGHSSIQAILEGGYVREPIHEIKSGDSKHTHGWSYWNGITIKEGYCVDVIHTENITSSASDSDYSTDRKYQIIDQKKDAYLVFKGELGYEVIRVIAE